mgnify:CR=1 FL=1
MRYAAPQQPAARGSDATMMLYQLHEFWRSGVAPYAYWAHAGAKMFSAGDSWLSSLPGADRTAAGFELAAQLTELEFQQPAATILRTTGNDPAVEQRGDLIAAQQLDLVTLPAGLLQHREELLAARGVQAAHLG